MTQAFHRGPHDEASAAPLVERRIDANSMEPGSKGGPSFKRVDLPKHGEEHVLNHFFGICLVSRDI